MVFLESLHGVDRVLIPGTGGVFRLQVAFFGESGLDLAVTVGGGCELAIPPGHGGTLRGSALLGGAFLGGGGALGGRTLLDWRLLFGGGGLCVGSPDEEQQNGHQHGWEVTPHENFRVTKTHRAPRAGHASTPALQRQSGRRSSGRLGTTAVCRFTAAGEYPPRRRWSTRRCGPGPCGAP